MSLAEFRATVADLAGKETELPLVPTIPDDVTHVPCVVVGRVTGAEAAEAGVEDLELDLTLIGRRSRADDPLAVGGELDTDCDALYARFGGSRGVKHLAWHLSIVSRRPALVQIAALDYEAYLLTVTGSHTTCT